MKSVAFNTSLVRSGDHLTLREEEGVFDKLYLKYPAALRIDHSMGGVPGSPRRILFEIGKVPHLCRCASWLANNLHTDLWVHVWRSGLLEAEVPPAQKLYCQISAI